MSGFVFMSALSPLWRTNRAKTCVTGPLLLTSRTRLLSHWFAHSKGRLQTGRELNSVTPWERWKWRGSELCASYTNLSPFPINGYKIHKRVQGWTPSYTASEGKQRAKLIWLGEALCHPLISKPPGPCEDTHRRLSSRLSCGNHWITPSAVFQ